MAPTARTAIVQCPHADTCGACALLGRTVASQLKGKRDALWAALDRHAALAGLEPLPTLESPLPAGYRNRAKMAVQLSRSKRAQVGYFRSSSRTIVDAPDCRVLVPEILETTRQLRELFSRPALSQLPLRFVDVRCGSDPKSQHLTLVVADPDMRLPLQEIRSACPFVRGISVNVNASGGPQVIKGPVKWVWGERHVIVETSGVKLFVSPGAFFQVNLSLLEPIHARIRDHFKGCTSLVDLYAGVGTHGLALAKGFEKVLCIEGVTAAVRDAKTSIDAAGLTHVGMHGAPVERALSTMHAQRPDAILLNPSREGARPEVLESICKTRAARVAYLSCDPSTLARDLARLVEGGFTVTSVQPIDMMPQTLQVEALALLEREVAQPAARERATGRERAQGRGDRTQGRDRSSDRARAPGADRPQDRDRTPRRDQTPGADKSPGRGRTNVRPAREDGSGPRGRDRPDR